MLNQSTDHNRMQVFMENNALLEGHFVLSSGKHSGYYLQCALLCQRPAILGKICLELAAEIKNKLGNQNLSDILVVSPALGGVIVGYELSRALNCSNVFAERPDGVFVLRRGFAIKPKQKVIVVEDVVTTGGSANEIIGLVRQLGADPIAVATLVDRSGKSNVFPVPLFSFLKLDIPVYDSHEIPDKLNEISITKPGSRTIEKSNNA